MDFAMNLTFYNEDEANAFEITIRGVNALLSTEGMCVQYECISNNNPIMYRLKTISIKEVTNG
jgi:hypothetical protein|tara:strand:- start:224 stop:412 length:189 start_codon:yes stop_codon:yes gene_type:complete